MLNLKSLFGPPRPHYPEPVAFTEIIACRKCWVVKFSGDSSLDWPLLTLINGWQTRFHRIDLHVPAEYHEFVRSLPFQLHVRIEPLEKCVEIPAGSVVLDLAPGSPVPAPPECVVLSSKPGANLQLDPKPRDGEGWLRMLGSLFRLPVETEIPTPRTAPDSHDILLDNSFPNVYIFLRDKVRKNNLLEIVTFLKQNLSANIYLDAPLKYRFDLPGFVEFDVHDFLSRFAFARTCDLTVADRDDILIDMPIRFYSWNRFTAGALSDPTRNADLSAELRARLQEPIRG